MNKIIASWFGRKEHFFALLLGGYLFVLMFVCNEIQYYTAFALWLIYHICHRLEKTFYGNNGYRN